MNISNIKYRRFHESATSFFVQFCRALRTMLMKGEGNVTPQFRTHGNKIIHYVNIVVKSWKGAQGQGPAIDLVFYVSAIKDRLDGYSAS